jgi:hypothetical protein
MKTETLKLVYFAYFHSIMSYGIIFWVNLTDSKKGIYIQNSIIRIMAAARSRSSRIVPGSNLGPETGYPD